MIRRLIINLTFCIAVAFPALAQQELTEQADSAYMRDDFATALQAYTDLEQQNGTSSSLF